MSPGPSAGGRPSPRQITERSFATSFRGYDPQEVLGFLHELSGLVDSLERELADTRARLAEAEEHQRAELDLTEERLTEALGEETARVLSSARQAAADIRAKAEENTARMVRDAAESAEATRRDAAEEAQAVRDGASAERADAERWAAEARAEAEQWATETRDEAQAWATETRNEAEQSATGKVTEAEARAEALREEAETEHQRRIADAEAEAGRLRTEAEEVMGHRRAEAEAEAEAVLDGARAEGREMVTEAQRVRERVLRDLSRRKKSAKVQLEQLRAARERLLEAYEVVRRTVDEATGDLNSAIPDARLAGDAAARRAEAEAEDSVEALEAELAAARDAGLPIVAPDGESGDAEAIDEAPGAIRGVDEEPTDQSPVMASAAALTASGADPDDSGGGDDEPTDQSPVVASPASPPGADGLDGGEGGDDEPTDQIPAVPPAASSPPAGASSPEAVAPEASPEPESSPPEPPTAEPSAFEPPFTEPSSTEPSSTEPPPPEPTPEPEVREDPSATLVPQDGLSPAPADEGAPEDGDRGDDGAGELFARIREQQASFSEAEADGSPADDVVSGAADDDTDDAASDTADSAISGELPVVGEGVVTLLEQRDGQVAAVERDLGRRVKRALADEENEVLDTVRRSRSVPGVDDILPSLDAHRASYLDAAVADLERAFAAGVDFAATDLTPDIDVAEVADSLVDDLCLPLRLRVERCAEECDDIEDLTDRLRSCYREWKRERVSDLVAHAALAAFSAGQFSALPDGALVRWVIDDSGRPCPDAEDNALAGTLRRGEAFPTGHRCPPAHAGCRCLVVAHVPEPAATSRTD